MDMIQHAAHGYIFGYAITAGLLEPVRHISGGLNALVGAAPDLIPIPDHLRVMLSEKKAGNPKWYMARDFSRLYQRTHHGDIDQAMAWHPAWGLHTRILDPYTHGPGIDWWKWRERLWAEVLSWLLTLNLLRCVL